MKYQVVSLLFMIAFACCSCGDSSTGDDTNADPSPDSVVNNVSIDTTHQSDTAVNTDSVGLRAVGDWKTADFIVTEKYKSSESVKRTIEWEVEEWKNVKSPLVAVYKGCDMGDYFHLNFEDSNGKSYDFGFGNNQFGEYTLCDKDINDNPKYTGKQFLVYWNWEISSFPCCNGDYDLVEAYLPSITKLELKE